MHRRAADWHLAHGSYEEAVHHFVACRDFTRAADTMNVWATRLTTGALLGTVERWYDQLPFAEVAKRPDLAIKIGYTLVFLRRTSKLWWHWRSAKTTEATHRGVVFRWVGNDYIADEDPLSPESLAALQNDPDIQLEITTSPFTPQAA